MPGKHLSQHKRGQWGRQIEFVLTLIGYCVGLGNVWRFPYLCFKNGGGAFLIPYVICLVLLGMPLFALEVAFGQFGGRGPLTIWYISPTFRGIGIAAVVISGVIQVYYGVVIAWAIYYLFASMAVVLPWQQCDECSCFLYQFPNATTETLLNVTGRNCSSFTGEPRAASEIYFTDKVLQMSPGIHQLGSIKWDITLCSLLGWVVVLAVLIKGIKSLGKVVYFTATVPYVILTVLLVRGVLLEGSMMGILFYLTPDFSKLADANVWSDAAVQVFFSMSACQGGLIAMSSYNRFDNNVLREAVLVPIIDCLTSIFAGFVVFSVLGNIAHTKNVTVANVTRGGPGLAFVVYPDALAEMPAAPLWAVLFFFLFCILGFSSQFSLVETVITSVFDEFPDWFNTRKTKYSFRSICCCLGFLAGLPFLTQGGSYLVDLVDNSIVGFPSLVVGVLELLVIVYVYGYKQFIKDVQAMTNIRPYAFLPCWMFITPVMIVFVIVASAVQHRSRTEMGDPVWAEVLYWLISLAPIVCVPLWFFYYSCPRGIWKRYVELSRPKREWKDRRFSVRTKAVAKWGRDALARTNSWLTESQSRLEAALQAAARGEPPPHGKMVSAELIDATIGLENMELLNGLRGTGAKPATAGTSGGDSGGDVGGGGSWRGNAREGGDASPNRSNGPAARV